MQNGQLLAIMICMSKVIFRIQKLKAAVSIRRSLKHAFREQDTPNADGAKANQNQHVGAKSGNEAMKKIRQRWPEKRRKDAVLAIEHLLTASPEWFEGKTLKEQNAFFNDGLNWLREKYGAENVVYAGIHRDEKTPHLYAYVVPLDESTGRLNAKNWVGGSKALTQLQDEIAAVAEPHGLERGARKSKARHKEVRTWYAEQKIAEATAGNAKKLKLTGKDRLALVAGKTPKVVEQFNDQAKAFQLVYKKMKNQLKGAESARIRCEMSASNLNQTELERSSVIRRRKREIEASTREREALEKRLNGAISKEAELNEKIHQLIHEKDNFERENAELIAELSKYQDNDLDLKM